MENGPDQKTSSTPRCLVLIGFMGSGKSSVGRKLQEQLGYTLIDTDQLIEKRQGKSIPKIFSTDGEDVFRDIECELLKELVKDSPSNRIISTGGGIILRESNRKLLRELGFVVWLKATPEEILERTSRNNHRPLLQTKDPKGAVARLMAERDSLYRDTAHLELDTKGLDIEEVCAGILDCASYHFTHGD